MRSWMIASSCGIALTGFIPELPGIPALFLLCLFTFLLLLLRPLRLLAAFLAGCCWCLVWAQLTLQQLWPESERQQEVLAQGTVWNLPRRTEQGWRFEFRLSALCHESTEQFCPEPDTSRAGHIVLLSVYEPLVLQPGQQWQFLLRLQRPHGFANPGGFDYEVWLLQQNIMATGYVRSSPLNQQMATNTSRPWFNRLRHWLSQLLVQADGGRWEWGALLQALTLGDMSGIGPAEWERFTEFGLNHLIVISGFHIALVAAVMFHVGLWLSRVSTALLLQWTAPRVGAFCAIAAAFCYTGLAGFNLPAVRAFVMVLVYLGGVLLGRQTAAFNSLSLAMLLVLLSDPLAPQSASFWLSFVAVAILLSQVHQQLKPTLQARCWQALRLQLLLSCCMLPVMLVFFQQSSVLAPVVNLLAIPYIGMLVVPLALFGLCLLTFWPTAGALLLVVCDFLLYCFLRVLEGVSKLGMEPLLSIALPSWPVLLALILLTTLMLLHRNPLAKIACLLLLPVLLLLPRPKLAAGVLQLTVFDVGQGLAILISTRNQQLLYDTGPRYSPTFDAGSDVLIPVLRRAGVTRLDHVIVSHGDADHAGGVPAIEVAFPAAHFMAPDIGIFSAPIEAQSCQDQQWTTNGATFTVLHPDASTYSSNNSSCVLLVDTGSIQVLLPGDIEREVELALLDRYPGLQADILIAPHHGSKTSSSYPFIKTLRPSHVIFSAGFHNRFGHPALEVQQRYNTLGVAALNTAYSGAISITIERELGITEISEYRRMRRRFWYQLP